MIFDAAKTGGQAGTVKRATDDLALCRRIAGGEDHLFAGLIDRFSPLVAGAVHALGIERSDVEDVAQQTFINVYKGMSGFRGDAKLSSWIYRIAINTARAHLRKLKRRGESVSVEQAMESGVEPVDLQTAGAEEVLRSRELAAALGELSEAQRSAITLYYLEELSYEEIAEALNMNLNTVRTQIRRAKQKLAGLLDSETPGL